MARASATLVISHWYNLFANLQASPMDFYKSVEAAIQSRKVPITSTSRVDWQEGGLFSTAREYLRVSRERHIFDICGSPYGTGFFVSWWLAEIRPSPIKPTLAAVSIISVLWLILRSIFGIIGGFFLTIISLIAIFLILGALISKSQGEDWVESVLVIPVLGSLFERFFRPVTYYRMDTALMFQQAVNAAVQEVIDEMTKAKGIRALSESERKPILRDFYQR